MRLRLLNPTLSIFALSGVTSQAALVWQVGIDDNGWPVGDGGGPNATFVQEAGTNALPGDPNSPEINAQADDDYYFAGDYSIQVDGGPAYAPVGIVAQNEEAAERALTGADGSLRYHFNLPASVNPTDLLSITFDHNNLDGSNGPDVNLRRYGVEVYFNNVLVMPEVVVYDPASGQPNWTPGSNVALLDDDITTPAFSLASVNAQIGAGFDNYVELRGINYNGSGGGNWMGVDYIQLDADPIPEPSVPLVFLVGIAGVALGRRRR